MNNSSNDTKIAFMRAFLKLYDKYSINSITISKLSKEAGFHRNTFYKNFTDIYEMLEFTKRYYAWLIAEKMSQIHHADTETIVEVFSKLETEIADDFLILLKRNNENSFTRCWADECKKVWREHFLKDEHDTIREYVFEYKVVGSISVLASFFEKRDLSTEEITKLMHELTSTNKWASIK